MNLSDPPHADPARPDPSRERLARILARLDTLVDWEKRDRSPGMRRGLAPMEDLMARLGSPQASFRAVHVAGTKGKGSTASLIAAGLARAGFSVGLYTSPHVDRVEERVRVDGRDVAAGELAEALERAFDAREAAVAGDTAADEATWFDLLTAAAFLVFQRRGVDWAVVECGLGGRLDSTNVVHGEVCVVTNIDLEHTAVLGNCFADIAREKGGIVKPGSVLVTGVRPGAGRPEEGDDPNAVLEQQARAAGVRLVRPPLAEGGDGRSTAEARNVALARTVLDELGPLIKEGSGGPAVSGELLDPPTCQAARLPGRLELTEAAGVPVAIDGAHVASSLSLVLEELRRAPADGAAPGRPGLTGRPVALIALGRDKDARGLLKALRAHADTVVCTTVPSGPLRPASELRALAAAEGFEATAVEEPERAFEQALDRAREGWLLVIGSFYLAGAVRAALRAGFGLGQPEPPC